MIFCASLQIAQLLLEVVALDVDGVSVCRPSYVNGRGVAQGAGTAARDAGATSDGDERDETTRR